MDDLKFGIPQEGMEMNDRSKEIDALRGILIFFVVLGHSIRRYSFLHDIIFLFHMPLFLILSGILISKERISEKRYFTRRAKQLLIPYLTYGMIDVLLFKHDIKQLLRLLWGGRTIDGVYWYVTCYLFSLLLLIFLLHHFSEKISKLIILIGGGIAVLESNLITGILGVYLSEKIPVLSKLISLLQSPGIPWNLDVSLLALVYLAIGYYYKKQIKGIMQSENKKCDFLAIIIAAIIAILCYLNYSLNKIVYYFDMKPVYYHKLLPAVGIPIAFGFVLIRFVRILDKTIILKWLFNVMAFLGKMTIPIMFIHVPINVLKIYISYNWFTYVFIGICAPIVFVVLFGKYSVMRRMFGIPNIHEIK